MKLFFYKRVIFFILFIFYISYLQAENKEDRKIDLNYDWEFYFSNYLDINLFTTKSSEFKYLKKLGMNSTLNLLENVEKGYFYFRKKIFIDSKIIEENNISQFGLYLGKVMFSNITIFNNTIIGKTPYFEKCRFNNWNTENIYLIPESIIKINDYNEIKIIVFFDSEFSFSNNIYITDFDKLLLYKKQNDFFNIYLNLIVIGILFFLFLYFLFMFIKDRKIYEHFFYAIFSFCSIIYQSNFILTAIPFIDVCKIDYFVYQKIVFACMILLSFFFLLFVIEFFKNRWNHLFTLISFFNILLILHIIFVGKFTVFIKAKFYYTTICLIDYLTLTVLLLINVFKKKKYSLVIFIAQIVFLSGVIFDFLANLILKSGVSYFSGISGLFLLVCIGFILSDKYIITRKELEKINIFLEEKIKERTKELEEKNIQLYNLATKDILTGLYNRIEMEKFLIMEIKRISRHDESGQKNGKLSLLFIDLDNFKYYNDTYGHKVGDQILIEFANILKKSLRASDFACRLGGDEFVIVLLDTNLEESKVVAKKIIFLLENLNENIILHIPEIENSNIKPEYKITCSIGIAEYSEYLSPSELIIRADKAMYKAKESGKNQYAFY